MTTSPPTSPVDICNLALDHIGEGAITGIDDPRNTREEIMARHYDHVRRTCLREYVWNFAQKYRVLARAGDGEGSYADAYTLPADCVRLNSLGEDIYNPITAFELSNRTIYASQGTSLAIRYNRDAVEVSYMDPLFISMFALRLAISVAYKFTKKGSVVDRLTKELAPIELKAGSVDGQERPPRRVQRSRYLAARYGYGSHNRDNRYYEVE